MSVPVHGHYVGGKPSSTYTSWQNMRTRCLNARDPSYKEYGARGVTVCRRWDSFENFLADMGARPTGRTLDRRTSTKGYSKANCRWSTPTQQARNRRSNRFITYSGETRCIADWAQYLGHNVSILKGRFRRGISAEIALTTPSKGPLYKRTRTK